MRLDKRRFPRLPIAGALNITKSNGEAIQARAYDLSIEGIGVSLQYGNVGPFVFDVTDFVPCSVHWALPACKGESVELTLACMAYSLVDMGDHCKIGLHFVEPEERILIHIQDYIRNCLHSSGKFQAI